MIQQLEEIKSLSDNYEVREKIDQLITEQKKLTYISRLDYLMIKVCEYFGISLEQLRSKCRKTHLVNARKMFTALAYEIDLVSFNMIGSKINRYHASIMYERDKHFDHLKTDEEYRDNFNRLKEILNQ